MKKIRMQQKYDTEANWLSANPILLAGEIAITFDMSPMQFKLGDGVNAWIDLPYYSSSESLFTNLDPTTVEVGGIPIGTTFLDKTMTEMWNALLYTEQFPVFTNFYADEINAILEVGYEIPLGNKTWRWTTANDFLFKPFSVQISGPGFTTVSGLANDKIEVIPFSSTVQHITTGSEHWDIQAENDNTGAIFSRSKIVSWKWRMFWGNSANSSLSEVEIEALAYSTLDDNFTGTFTFGATGYKYFVYPTAFGIATSFIDAATSFPVAMNSYTTISITNTYGITTNYYVHRTTNPIVTSLNIIIS